MDAPEAPDVMSTVFPAVAPSASAARRFVAAALRRWDIAEDVVEQALLLTSELVTNAYRHAGTHVRLSVAHRPGRLRVEAHDAGEGRPHLRPLDTEDEDGRGLNIVAVVADRWGTTTSESGTLVWFELASTPSLSG